MIAGTVKIKPHQHLLPGIGDVEYMLNEQCLSIIIDGSMAAEISGSKVSIIFGHASVIAGGDAAYLEAKAIIEEATGFTITMLVDSCRKIELVDQRHIAMWWMRKNTNWTYTRIGEFFKRDHTTAQHAYRKIEAQVKSNPIVRKKVMNFLTKVNTHDERDKNKNQAADDHIQPPQN